MKLKDNFPKGSCKRKLPKYLPLVALATGALPALSNADSISGLYWHVGGGAENVAVTTLGSEGSGVDPIIVAAIINSSGAVEVIAYKDTNASKTGIQRIGFASDGGGCCGFIDSTVAITPLDSKRVATAVVGVFGLLSVQTWTIGSDSVTETGSAGSSYGSGGLDLGPLAIAAVSSSEVVTAARDDGSGQLVVMDWQYQPDNGFENPINADAAVTGVVSGNYGALAMVATQSNQVAVAECDSEDQLKLIAWKVGSSVGYLPVRQGSNVITSGCPVAASVSGELDLLGGRFVSTAALGSGGALQVATTQVTSSVAAPTVYAGWPGSATQVAICGDCSIDGFTQPLTAEIGHDGKLWLSTLGLNLNTNIDVNDGLQSIGIAPEGADSSGKFHFVTAIVNGGGNVQINTWELKP
jgi:hypothetical protein